MSGRANINYRLPEAEHHLHSMAWDLYAKGELQNLADKFIKGESNLLEAVLFLKIGLFCSLDIPEHRPLMSQVVKILQGEEGFNEEILRKPDYSLDAPINPSEPIISGQADVGSTMFLSFV